MSSAHPSTAQELLERDVPAARATATSATTYTAPARPASSRRSAVRSRSSSCSALVPSRRPRQTARRWVGSKVGSAEQGRQVAGERDFGGGKQVRERVGSSPGRSADSAANSLPHQSVRIAKPLTIHMGGPGARPFEARLPFAAPRTHSPSRFAGLCVDAKGRQRTEILSWPPAAAGETWI